MAYNDGDDLNHADLELPEPTVHAAHPFRNLANHDKLKDYVTSRLMFDKSNRDMRVQRYAQIDRDVAGWMRLSEDDKRRREKHKQDGTPQAVATNLPLTWVHLDDMMTYYAQTFAPNRGMFYHTGGPDEQGGAEQITKIMNNHAVYGGYYRQLLLSLFSIHKYNLGGLETKWVQDYGPGLKANPDGSIDTEQKTIFAGNKAESIDMYNLFYDPSVNPTHLHKEGEWYAIAKMRSHYWLKNACLEGRYYNAEEILEGETASQNPFSAMYYLDPPSYSLIQGDESASQTSWFSILSGGQSMMQNSAFELVTMYIRISPNDFGLIPGNATVRKTHNRYETWKITLLNNEKIIEIEYQDNLHNYLPVFFGVLNDDVMEEAAKSAAEILNPLQDFSSFLLNTHIKGTRKNIFGTTYYDPSCVDYAQVPEGEVAARVPLKPQGYGKDIRTMVQHDNGNLDTKQTLTDLQGMISLIDQFFPTQSLPSAIAGIDRAVDSQVAAVQQGANRRQHKGARLLDDTMMRPFRFSLYFNIVQYIEDGATIVDYFKGTSDTVDLSALREVNLSYVIGQGLKALDRMATASQLQSLIFALIQAPQAAQGINILKMLDFWSSMMDIDTNMEQFALPPAPPPQPGGAPGTQTPTADAAGNPISPATNPSAVTAPIYGS